MKIGQVCPYNIHRPGGVQDHILGLSSELRSRGHTVKIIAPRFEDKQPHDKDTILLGNSAAFFIDKTQIEISVAVGKMRNPLIELFKKEKFDLLHLHNFWSPVLPLQILYESDTCNIGTIHGTASSTMVGRSIEKIFKPVANYAIHSLDCVIAVSSVPARYFKTFYNGPIHIIPNGIDLTRFSPENKPFTKYQDGKINILFLGRLDKRKGVMYLVKAFRNLKKEFDNIRLLIAGEGEELQKISKYIDGKHIDDIELLGFIEEEDKPRWYATGDIFCSPALYGESFGIVLIEAMASGKPVVACANPGYKTVLTGKGSTFLAEPKNVSDLESKLKQLISDNNLRKRMGKWGITESKKYSWKNVTDEILKMYALGMEEYNKGEDTLKREHKSKIQSWITKMVQKVNHYYS